MDTMDSTVIRMIFRQTFIRITYIEFLVAFFLTDQSGRTTLERSDLDKSPFFLCKTSRKRKNIEVFITGQKLTAFPANSADAPNIIRDFMSAHDLELEKRKDLNSNFLDDSTSQKTGNSGMMNQIITAVPVFFCSHKFTTQG